MTDPGRKRRWSHPSVGRLGGEDPIAEIEGRARSLVLAGVTLGWSGPPYDPMRLASLLGITLQPCQDILDARTVALPGGGLRIEFNPSRPPARLRYSIAHELAHTLFPDCAEQVRYRHTAAGPEWELEMLCNVGAAEILMPIGSFGDLTSASVSVDALVELRKRYEVSFEALFLRLAKLTRLPLVVYALSRQEDLKGAPRYRVDYVVRSRSAAMVGPREGATWDSPLIAECTGIGYTSKGIDVWEGTKVRLECVGIPAYPGRVYPRVLALATPLRETGRRGIEIVYLKGDATEPRGEGQRIVAQVVNDKAALWGGGFARVIRGKWPDVQAAFREWASASSTHLKLGQSLSTRVDDTTEVFSMVAQHGYGRSQRPGIRYDALRAGLRRLAARASETEASVHMPRIGCGEAGGDWDIVSELIDDALCRVGVSVFVYDLPHVAVKRPAQGSLPFGRRS